MFARPQMNLGITGQVVFKYATMTHSAQGLRSLRSADLVGTCSTVGERVNWGD